MSGGIQSPELKNVEQLLTGDTRYQVPKYQRSFSWGDDEVEDFWQDLVSAVRRSAVHFLGTIVLQEKESGPQQIIDGQQRLACISMLFSAIRHVFTSGKDHERATMIFTGFLGAKGFARGAVPRPKLVLNETNNDTFVRYVIASTGLPEVGKALKDKALHESNRALLKAYRFFLEKVASEVGNAGLKADDFLESLIDCLRSRVKLISIPVTTEEDANLFFESLNARGKELAISDLVKNRLFFEAKAEVKRAQELWALMEAELGRRPIPEFLRHYWIAKKVDQTEFTVREKQLYRFIADEVRNAKKGTIRLLDDLATSARDYTKISDYELWPDDDDYGDDFKQSLEDLAFFRVTQCNPVLLNAIQCFTRPEDIARVFRTVVNFSFRYFLIGNRSPGSLERASNGIAAGIRRRELKNPVDVAGEFRKLSPDTVFADDFAVAQMPRRKAKLARYTLAALSDSIPVGAETCRETTASSKLTLEHVLPQGIPDAWRRDFPPPGVDPRDYVCRIGNLTLLASKPQSDAADRSFKEKKSCALDGSKLPINADFRLAKKWTDAEIIKPETCVKFASKADVRPRGA